MKSFRGEPTAREFALVQEIAPHALAEEVYHVLSHPKLRLALVKKSKRQPLLALAATRDMHEETALAALENVQSTPALQEISEKSRHNSVRQEALAKWKAKREQETVTPKAEDVLLLQCKALISQAERLAEAKPILAQEEAFALLMQEASKMDLGESKAKLDSLYNTFLEKVAIEKEKEALAEKERQALAEKQAMRAKLLEDWNALLQAPQTDENVALMQELKQKAETLIGSCFYFFFCKNSEFILRQLIFFVFAPKNSLQICVSVKYCVINNSFCRKSKIIQQNLNSSNLASTFANAER